MKYNRPLLAFAALLASAGCVEPDEVVEVLWDLHGDVDRLDFGAVLLGSTSAIPVAITNTGSETATILSLGLEGSSNGVIFLESGWAGNVDPTQTFEQVVLFHSSTAGGFADTLVITVQTAGNETRTVEIPLRGEAVTEKLRSYPILLDFGHAPPGEIITRGVFLENLTTSDLEVFSWGVSEALGFGLIGPEAQPDLPWTIPPQSTIEAQVVYTSTDDVEHMADLFFQSTTFASLGLPVSLLVNDCVNSSDPSWDSDSDGTTLSFAKTGPESDAGTPTRTRPAGAGAADRIRSDGPAENPGISNDGPTGIGSDGRH